MRLALIVAASENNVIGNEGGIPWELPSDMKRFRVLTVGNAVIMGRKTYESIPEQYRPLPGRSNIVISSTLESTPGFTVVGSLDEAIAKAEDDGEVIAFVIGGGGVYREAIPLVEEIFLTRVKAVIEGDTFFPEIDPLDWELEGSIDMPPENGFAFSFENYIRRSS